MTTEATATETLNLQDARALYAAAAIVVGGVGDTPEIWAASVADVAHRLENLAKAHVAESAELAKATVFAGRIVAAKVVTREGGSGSAQKGEITFEPTTGSKAGTGEAEAITTDWLTNASAAAVFAEAQRNIGNEVFFWKRMETGDGADGRKFRTVIRIEPRNTNAQAPVRSESDAPVAAGGGTGPQERPRRAPAQSPPSEAAQPQLPVGAAAPTSSGGPVPTTQGQLLSMAAERGLSSETVRARMLAMFGSLEPGAVRPASQFAEVWAALTQPELVGAAS